MAETVSALIARNKESFSFLYQETIDSFAQVRFFDPETEVPSFESIDLLYLPGGYPEKHLEALVKNEACRKAIKDYAEQGGRIVAECGGMMYLCQSIVTDDGEYAMCGVLPYSITARKADRKLSLGYRRFVLDGKEYRGHEFHYTQFYRGEGSEVRGERLAYNLVYLASCEEEVSGANGFSLALPQLPKIDVAIVGEPTGMQPAIAERGLMVIDGLARGKSGHAARNEGVNAIYEALDDLVWLRDYRFSKISALLGATKMTVTVLNSGTQHNVVPDECRFVIDVRPNEYYQNEYLFAFLQNHMKKCELTARSFRLRSSHIDEQHPLVQRCKAMGLQPFGSPTLSDQALMPFPSFKLGPGDSARSHSADEFICFSEIEKAIATYVELLS